MKDKKQFSKSAIVVTIILMLAATSIFATVPFASAETKMVETFSFIAAAPNPVGVGQNLLVTFRLDKVSPNAGALGAGTMFTGFTVKITLPDGSVFNKTGLTTDSTSNGWFIYVPTMVGQYKLQTIFPGQRINGSSFSLFGLSVYDNTYLPSQSPEITVNVTSEPVLPMPNNPLPTGYWTTPIYGENKGWNEIADNWLMEGYDFMTRSFGSGNNAFAPYTIAPNSAHILWTKQIMLGGLVGGPFGDVNYYQGLSYEEHYNPLILDGKIIFTEHYLDQSVVYQTRCVNLYTGEDVWILNDVSIKFAQVVNIDTPNEHGALAYLWDTGPGGLFSAPSTTWKMYDAYTGRYMCSIANVTWGGPGGFGVSTAIPGPKGEILAYTLDSTRNRMILWNSTKVLYNPTFLDTWGPTIGETYDGNRGIEWNVSIPPVIPGTSLQEVKDGYAFATYADNSVVPPTHVDVMYDVSQMKKDSNGNYPTTLSPLWTANRTGILETYYIPGPIGSGIYTMYDEARLIMHAYSLRTGAELWSTEPYTSGWASFNWQWQIAYDKLFVSGYDGHVRAYDTSNGRLLWDYYFGSAGYETPYGTYPVYSGFTIADGKLYVTNDEHSPDSVPWRGGKLWCLDVNTGDLIWSISGKLRMGAISNGYYTTLNSLDGKIYTFGKGPSKTTVSAPQIAAPLGTPIVITGTVTDQSPGSKDTPAISDADMSAWMEYLHQQKPMPANAKGVEVKLTAIDPNGNLQNIGTATTDLAGSFGISWIPPVEGLYQITATFEGTNSYAGSFATTYMTVGSAAVATSPSVSPSVVPEPESSAPAVDIYVVAAVIVIVIVVIAVVAVFLRKRK
ncbi:MAG: PQQ-binding-like beta-propeller repeat protein [Candidatus Bathyarchaeota archaeon]|nr:PQQ-binding-like beta-propeller repeat protein [Candidatus Bathyarchaeota archaeon]